MLITYKTNAHSPDHMGFTAQYEVRKGFIYFAMEKLSGIDTKLSLWNEWLFS